MKWNCELIQDLLPLYEEGLASPTSARAVREHLDECEACRRLTAPLPIPEEPEAPAADRAVAKSMRKVRHRWLASLLVVVLLVPLVLMSFNQFRGVGLCFTNLDDTITAWRFLNALETQDWETAAKMYNFSGDYESIREALDLSVSDWGSSFTPVTVGDAEWMLKSYLDCNAMEGDAANALFQFLYNRVGTAMVPEALWAQVIAVDPSAVQQEGNQYWLNDEYYSLVSTPWGGYVISNGLNYSTAFSYCSRLDLVPAAIYAEAQPELEAEAQRLYDTTHAAYGYVADMTEDQFRDWMVESYAADLRALEDMGVTIDCTGYQSAYRLGEGGWHIQFHVTLTHQGEPLETTMAIGVEDGLVHMASISYRQGVEWLDELENALYPSAHPDY